MLLMWPDKMESIDIKTYFFGPIAFFDATTEMVMPALSALLACSLR